MVDNLSSGLLVIWPGAIIGRTQGLGLSAPTKVCHSFSDRLNDLGHDGTSASIDEKSRNSAPRIGEEPISDLGFGDLKRFQKPFAGILQEVAADQRPGTMIALLPGPGLILYQLDDVPSVVARPGKIQIAITI